MYDDEHERKEVREEGRKMKNGYDIDERARRIARGILPILDRLLREKKIPSDEVMKILVVSRAAILNTEGYGPEEDPTQHLQYFDPIKDLLIAFEDGEDAAKGYLHEWSVTASGKVRFK